MQQMVYLPKKQVALMYGGADLDTSGPSKLGLGDLWEYDVRANTWSELRPSGDQPPTRVSAAMAYDEGSGKVLLFGGYALSHESGGSSFVYLNDLWAYDPAANKWSERHGYDPLNL